LTEPFVQALAADPVTPAIVYAGSNQRVFKSVTAAPPGPRRPVRRRDRFAIDPVTPATLYVATRRSGVFKSFDAAELVFVQRRLPSSPALVLAIDPVTPTTVYLVLQTAGVFKSTDGGNIGAPSTAA